MFTLHSGQMRTEFELDSGSLHDKVHTPHRSDRDWSGRCSRPHGVLVHTPLRSDEDWNYRLLSELIREFTLHSGQMGTEEE